MAQELMGKRYEKIHEILIRLLSVDNRYFTDEGELLKNAVYEDAMKMDSSLIKLLLSDNTCKARFFTEVDGVLVFDKVGFGWVVNNRQFLPDSYTRFKNKIGLTDSNGDFISSSNDVVLSFPYKDCVLEGGQSKEDQKREEIFYNETLAPEEVDRLLYPKVFTGAKRYSKDGVEENITFNENDNLIIKGNNLLAIASLLSRYEGRVKSIFVDPPYYFKKIKADDAFKYNSNFRLSTWLTFCKDRFIQAKKLLSDDGVLTVTMGVDGYCHLKLILDEIFDVFNYPSNYIGTITWRKTDNQSNIGEFSNVIDYILIYKKSERAQLYNLALSEKAIKEYSYEDSVGKYRRANLLDLTRGRFNYNVVTPDGTVLTGPWMIEKSEFDILVKNNGIHWPEKGLQIPYGKTYLKDSLEKGQIPSDFWDGSYGTNQRGADEIKELFGERAFPFAKPEKLVMNILSITSKPEDILLDFCLGSGTTCAVAHKMGRRYIGVDQMDYIETIAVERMKKVIDGEKGGVSDQMNWQGGGSFVYCELAQLNQTFVEAIQSAKNDEQLASVWAEMRESGFISSYVKPQEIDPTAEDFNTLSFADKKRLFLTLLDKNMLYVNYCDIDDERYAISDEDKAFTHSFYKDS